uniref:vWA domain-containing protein n=1 Tax=Novipirellula sp. TaxID=2795430 RepID=UPI00356A1DFC
MSWISTLTPLHWALFSLIPIGIILLYFLKLRREPVEVPSTFLWKKTIEDLHVNSLLQRLRRSILLFLQLLIVALAAFAMLRPGVRGETSSQGRLVFLIDTSASMQTTDVGDDANRFEKAKRLVAERIEAMSDSETAMLVSFSDRAEVLQSFTSDRNRLRDALSRAEVTNRPTDVLGALKAADGLANPRRTSEAGDVNDVQVADAMPADLLLYSDGGFQTVTEFDLGNLTPTYIPIGSGDVTNLAITAFSAERNIEKPEQVQIFATVLNLGTGQASATATLTLDDELLDASSVDLPVGEQAGLSFSIESEEAISLKLALDIKDDLAIDNVAYAALTPMRNVSVLVVTPGNTPLEMALSTSKAGKICQSEFVPPEFMSTDSYK